MKVLIISTCSIEKNGITNVIFNLISNVENKDIYFDIVSINNPNQCYKDKLNEICGGRIIYLNRDIKHIFKYIAELKSLIKQEQYDIVHAHGNSATLFFEMFAAMIAGCKNRIAHSHNTTCTSRFVDCILRPFFYLTYTNGFACGREAGKWLFKNKPYTVINNGINVRTYAYSSDKRISMRNQLAVSDDTILIGHVGGFNEQKNQKFLIEIFRVLYEQNENYKLLLIGDGRLWNNVKALSDEYSISSRVIFLGGVSNVHEYLSACDIIVMPSLYEGLPLALMEAQANGLPCVISDSITKEVDKTGNVEFVPLENGAEYWAKVIKNTSPFLNRVQSSKEAIDNIVANEYSIEEEAKKLEKYYIRLCKTIHEER